MAKTIQAILTLDDKKFKTRLSDSQKQILKIITTVQKFGIALGNIAIATARFQDDMIKAARATGSTVEEFSVFNQAAELAGVSMDTLRGGLIKLTRPSEQAKKTLDDLGVTLTNSEGKLKSQSELLGDIADGFQKIESPQKKVAAAFTLFEEAGTRMVNVLKDGSAGLREMREETKELGLVVSTEAAENAEQFNETMLSLGKSVTGVKNAIGESVIQFANQSGIMEGITGVMVSLRELWEDLSDSTKRAAIAIVAVVSILGALTAVIAGLIAIAPALKAAFAFMTGPIGIMITVVTTLIGVFLAFNKTASAIQKEIDKDVLAFKRMNTTILELSKRTKLTTDESIKLAEANEELRKTAEDLGVALEDENGKLRDTPALLRAVAIELKKTAIDEFERSLAVIENTEEALRKWLLQFKKLKKDLVDLEKPIEKVIDNNRRFRQTIEDIKEEITPLLLAYKENVFFVSELEQAMNKLNEVLDESDKQTSDTAVAVGKLAQVAANTALIVTNAFGQLAEAVTAGTQFAAEVALRNLEKAAMVSKELFDRQRVDLEEGEERKLKLLEDSFEEQIRLIREQEDLKLDALESAKDARLLLLDDEFQQEKARREAEFAAQQEQELANFEIEKELLLAKAIDKEQRRFAEIFLDEDFKQFMLNNETAFQQSLSDFQKEFLAGRKTETQGFKDAEKNSTISLNELIEQLTEDHNEALEEAEKEKNQKLADLDAQRTAQEKAEEKDRLQTQFNAEVTAFEQTKAVKIADTILSGIAAAAQAFNALFPIPFVGPVLGGIAAGAVLAATAQSVSNIQSQRPIKPASLLQEGGLIAGSQTHERGGILAEVESGELVVDRRRTSQLLNAIENTGTGRSLIININEGAFVGAGIDSEEAARRMSDIIAQQLRRQGIVA